MDGCPSLVSPSPVVPGRPYLAVDPPVLSTNRSTLSRYPILGLGGESTFRKFPKRQKSSLEAGSFFAHDDAMVGMRGRVNRLAGLEALGWRRDDA
jgi:hypothetical protein